MKVLRFGLGIPTGTEGLMYPIPYASAQDNVRLAQEAERLGFDSVWGNDHMTVQRYVEAETSQPPNYYELLTTLTYIAASTTRIKLGTALLVLPFRNPVVVAKQVATMDQLSGGRVLLGIGIGAYREEFEAMFPGRQVHRGRMVDEGIQALRTLFTEDRSSFNGENYCFKDIRSYPKPLQDPFPIYSGGNALGCRRRAAELCQGWLPAVLSPSEVSSGVEDIHKFGDSVGRDVTGLDIALQLTVTLGKTHEEALKKFRASQLYKHLESLKKSTLRDQQGGYEERNLIGTPDDICEQVRRYEQAGVTTLAALLFTEPTVSETLETMEIFARQVISNFG